jgi:hypothetical protein
MNDDNTLRVPTLPLAAEIRYFDERPMIGRIFLPSAAQHHDGPMRPDEWMNQTTLFFPFQHADGGRPVILNKRYVVVLTIALDGLPFAGDDEEAVVPSRVRVQCGTLELTGDLYIAAPETQRRLLDFANRNEAFLSLHDGDRRHLIQKNRITTITEIVED